MSTDATRDGKNFVLGITTIAVFLYLWIYKPFLLPLSGLMGVNPADVAFTSGLTSSPSSLVPDNTLANVLIIAYYFVCGVGAIVGWVVGNVGQVLGAVLGRWVVKTETTVDDNALELIKQSLIQIQNFVNPLEVKVHELVKRLDKLDPPPPTLEEQLAEARAKLAEAEKQAASKSIGVR